MPGLKNCRISRASSVVFPDDVRLKADTASYKAFTRDFDEEVGALGLIPTKELARLADYLKAPSGLAGKPDEPLPDLKGTLVTMPIG